MDRQGQVWASVLPGLPGFIESPTDKSLHVRTPVPPHDPLVAGGGLQPGAPIGLLGMQLDTRRRNRANGKVARVHDGGRGGFDFALDISFGNCPKVCATASVCSSNSSADRHAHAHSRAQYIQTRTVEFTKDAGERLGRECEVVETEGVLTPEMRAYVARSDTFFVARYRPIRLSPQPRRFLTTLLARVRSRRACRVACGVLQLLSEGP